MLFTGSSWLIFCLDCSFFFFCSLLQSQGCGWFDFGGKDLPEPSFQLLHVGGFGSGKMKASSSLLSICPSKSSKYLKHQKCSMSCWRNKTMFEHVESKPFTLHISFWLLCTHSNFSQGLWRQSKPPLVPDLQPNSVAVNARLIRGYNITRSVVDFSGVKASFLGLILDGLNLYIAAFFSHHNSTHKAL